MFLSKYGLKSKNVLLLYIVNIIHGLIFFLPIRALYYEQELFTVANVALIFALEALFLALLEVPSGAIADLFGRKRTIVLSFFMSFIGITILFIGGSMWIFVLFALINSFGRSLWSGTDTAIMYDTLKAENKENYFKKIYGTYSSLWPFGAAIGSIVGGHAATVSLGFPVVLTLIPIGLCLFVVFFLEEPEYHKEDHKNVFKHMFHSSKFIFSSRQLILLLFGSVILVGVGEVAHLLNPIFFEAKGVPLAMFGYIGAWVFGMSSLGFYISNFISEKCGDKKTLILAALLSPVLIFIAVATNNAVAALIYASASLFYGIRMPLIQHFINEDVPSSKRATVVSISNFAGQIGLAIIMPFVGYLTDLYSINTAFIISGVVMLIAPLLYLFLKEKN